MKRMAHPVRVGTFALVAALVACGSNSSGTKGGSSVPSDGSNSTSGSTGSHISEAESAVAALTSRPTKIQITEPLDKAVPKDKKIVYLECSIPDCKVLTPPAIEAAKNFGWTVQVINSGITPESVKAAWGLAVRAKPDAVISGGFPKSIFSSELAQLKAMDIPVIDGFVTDTVGDGISAVVQGTSTSKAIGTAFANWVLSEKGSKADVLLVHSSTFATLSDVKDGFNTEYSKLCAACKVKTIDVPATSFGSTLPAQIVATLRSNPSINYVVAEEGTMLLGLPQAMKAAGITTIGVIDQYPSQASLEYLKDGSIVKALVMPPIIDSSYTSIDALARVYTGQSVDVDDAAAPLWILTPKTAGDLQYPFYLTPGYQQQYQDLWKKGIG